MTPLMKLTLMLSFEAAAATAVDRDFVTVDTRHRLYVSFVIPVDARLIYVTLGLKTRVGNAVFR